MSRSAKKRRALFGAALGIGAALSIVLAGVLAGAGSAQPQTAPKNTGQPSIQGTAVENNTLTATTGTWSGSPTAFVYRWLRCPTNGGLPDGSNCGRLLSPTTKSAYQVRPADVGFRLRVRVTASNADGSASAASNATSIVTAAAPPPATGCPKGSGLIQVADLAPPARLLLDSQRSDPTAVQRGTQRLIIRYHVSACGGRSVQGALVYATAVPFNQFNVPAEQTTNGDGVAQLDFHVLSSFPLSRKQGLLMMFARARKSGDPLLGGISTRRLFSIRVNQ